MVQWGPILRRLPALIFVGVCLRAGVALAVPAHPDSFAARQPDGSAVKLFLRGDEHGHWHEDQAGYAATRSAETGQWVYAREVDGAIVPTVHVVGQVDPGAIGLVKPDGGRIVARAGDRPARDPAFQQSLTPQTEGSGVTRMNLVILVNFSDLTIPYSNAQYEDLFNQVGYTDDGAVGSVKDYYHELTFDAVTVESVVVGPVTLDNGHVYYGGNVGGDDANPQQMVWEAIDKLEDPNYGFDFDFSTVDGDNSGSIDGLTVIHAGGGEEYGGNNPNYIWSHFSIFGFRQYDGVSMAVYHTEPARRGWDGYPSTWGVTRIGVICHEMGHFFGLPDLYDYGGDSRGAGDFCLMAGGSWNGDQGNSPAHMSAWCKSNRGLVTPTVISTPGVHALEEIVTTGQVYKLQGPFASDEYFLVENRQGAGFDAQLPGSSRGLLIWHVDESQPNNDNQNHYKVDVEEASGPQHLQLNQSSGNDLDYFRLGNATEFTDRTTPNNANYGGTFLGLNVTDVSATGPNMSFEVSFPYEVTVNVVNPAWGDTEIAPDSTDPNALTYPKGTEVTLTASPIEGKQFQHWEVYDPNHPGDANYAALDANDSIAIMMDADREVTAVFNCGSGAEPLLPMMALGLVALVRRRK